MDAEVAHDPRTSNRMDPDSRAIHNRLEAWGAWAKDDASHVGWPESIFGAIERWGGDGAAQKSKPPISMPDEIAAVDAAVARLGQIDRRAITAYYTRWEPPEAVARRLHMRYREFQNVLKRARWRLIFLVRA